MEKRPPTVTANGKVMGRPLGSVQRMAREAREAAQRTGILPHEFLLQVARGEQIVQMVQVGTHVVDGAEEQVFAERFVYPDFDRRVDAAKAAAPYYAPKISTVEVIAGVSDDDLNAIIAGAAAEAGVSLGADGEGEEGEAAEGQGVRAGARPRARVRV